MSFEQTYMDVAPFDTSIHDLIFQYQPWRLQSRDLPQQRTQEQSPHCIMEKLFCFFSVGGGKVVSLHDLT